MIRSGSRPVEADSISNNNDGATVNGAERRQPPRFAANDLSIAVKINDSAYVVAGGHGTSRARGKCVARI